VRTDLKMTLLALDQEQGDGLAPGKTFAPHHCRRHCSQGGGPLTSSDPTSPALHASQQQHRPNLEGVCESVHPQVVPPLLGQFQ
jgi:hypothetical protein